MARLCRFVRGTLAVGTIAIAASCREPTQLRLDVSTNLRCTEIREVGISVASAPELAEGGLRDVSRLTTRTTSCRDGFIGSLVVTPGTARGAIAIVAKYIDPARPDADLATCAAPDYTGCIVARRRFAFLDHTTLRVSVNLTADCKDIGCDVLSSCRDGRCADSELQCSESGDCALTGNESGDDAGGLPDGARDSATDSAMDGGQEGGTLPILGPSRIVAGDTHTCAVLPSGNFKCWGNNVYGELGDGDSASRGTAPGEMGIALPLTPLGAGRKIRQLASYGQHTCAVFEDGAAKCWGHNPFGELGTGDAFDRGADISKMGDALSPIPLGTGRTVQQIAVGDSHSCALLDNGDVKCWGYNASGQLGYGDTTTRGDSVQLGDALPSVDLGHVPPVRAIAAGESRSCAIFDDGSIKCWGHNVAGELGIGGTADHGGNSTDMGDALPFVQLGTNVRVESLVVGATHTCALLSDHRVKCWGYNPSGALCDGDVTPRGQDLLEMGDHLPFASLGTGRTALALEAGYDFSCAILDNNTVKCWGANSGGELGLGSTGNYGNTMASIGDSLPALDLGTGDRLIGIASGRNHSCVMFEGGAVKCWGQNGLGQLGHGDTKTTGDQPGEMGTQLPFVDLGL
jgi:alpha-tubulin suppressor-like RCC1 family protein